MSDAKTILASDQPGLQVSRMYSPFEREDTSFSTSGGTNGSNPVPFLSPSLTKRFVIGVVRCEPGRNERAPLLAVHFSKAIQNPRADGGSVY